MSLIVVLLVLLSCIPSRADMAGYVVSAPERTAQLEIDGLIEPAWLGGGRVDSFIQREPSYPAPATQRSEVYMFHDADALYFAYMLYDSAPDSVRGQIQRRDNDSNSDFVDLYIDTFHDQRAGYWFTVTAAGVQAEGTFFNENDLTNAWDAVWESAVARTDSGWSCELRIPFQILRHGGPRDEGWGIAFARKIYRLNEGSFWPPVDPEIGWKASRMGLLQGLDNIAPSAHLEILPHVVGRWDAARDELGQPQGFRSENEWENIGLTLKYVPSAALSIDAAYQPDFAQVDVDEAVINLENYPVFLSEKRPFFLESKEYFEETPYQLVYTRRVTDPDFGGRVNVQQGRYKLSAFAGRNRLRYQDSDAEERELSQNGTFGRASVDFRSRHRVGVTWTYLEQDDYTAGAAGVDARFRFRERDRLWFWLAGVERSGNPVQHSWRVDEVRDEQPVEARASYGPDLGPVRADLAVAFRGTDYDINDLGWGSYSNTLRQSFWIGDNYYLEGSFIRNIGFDVNTFRSSLGNGDHPDGYANVGFFATTRTNWHTGGGMEWGDTFFRRLLGPTGGEHRDNFGTFDLEYYKHFWHWFWIRSDQTKPFRYGTDMRYRSYRDGELANFEPYIFWLPRSNVEITSQIAWNRVWHAADFADETTDFRNWLLKATWSPSLHLSFRGTLQWIEKSYYGDQGLFFANLLMSYNWSPGSWFYVVYDETGRDIDRPLELEKSIPGDRTLRAKLTYFFTVP